MRVQVVREPLDKGGLKEADAVRYFVTDIAAELFEENVKAIKLVGAHVGGLVKDGKLTADNVRLPRHIISLWTHSVSARSCGGYSRLHASRRAMACCSALSADMNAALTLPCMPLQFFQMLMVKEDEEMEDPMLVDIAAALPFFMAALDAAAISPPSLSLPFPNLVPSYTPAPKKQEALAKYGL